MKKIILIVALFFTIIQVGLAQNSFDKVKLDRYFEALESNNKFMGSVTVSKNGVMIYSKSIGFSDVENNIKANEKSKYRVGSISKSFTTVLIFKAIEAKKIGFDQTVDKYFPTIKNSKQITVKHLLSHRSGIHNFTDDKDYLTWNTQPKTEKEMIEIITKGGSDFKPDSTAEYSNSNFVLLTYILEKTFKKSFSDLLQQYICQPLNLTDTYVFGKINPNKNECKSYAFAGTWKVQPETDVTIPLGAGAIISTTIDLTKFADALFGGKLLKAESLEKMKTIKDGYGIGLFQIPFYKSIGYGHTGGIDGFSSIYSYFSGDNISYALTSNGTNYDNNNISIAVLSAVYDKPYEIPKFSTYNVTSENLDKYLGVYSSKQIGLKVTITKEGNNLIAQATGQSSFPLEATEKDKFKFDKAKVVLEFNPTDSTLILKQGGGQFMFARE
jgi:D-alanyl-D-alanine carboxypeptidase